jgi:hypothetical protein
MVVRVNRVNRVKVKRVRVGVRVGVRFNRARVSFNRRETKVNEIQCLEKHREGMYVCLQKRSVHVGRFWSKTCHII